jgi:hypothetical protein
MCVYVHDCAYTKFGFACPDWESYLLPAYAHIHTYLGHNFDRVERYIVLHKHSTDSSLSDTLQRQLLSCDSLWVEPCFWSLSSLSELLLIAQRLCHFPWRAGGKQLKRST